MAEPQALNSGDQAQSRFFSLPGELRDQIYCFVLFNGASEQHVEPHFMTVPPPYRWLRLPCFPSPDEDFLASTLVDHPDRFAYDLLRNTNCWRHGHLPCSAMAAMAQSLPPGAPGPLPSPLPLFLTCRRIYEEAGFRFYHLSVGGIFRLEQFLGCLTKPTLDRMSPSPSTPTNCPRHCSIQQTDGELLVKGCQMVNTYSRSREIFFDLGR